MVITKTTVGGNIVDQRMKNSDSGEGDHTVPIIDDKMKAWFKFVQTQDGSVPAVLHSREENSEVLNVKKAIASAFQANFLGTGVKEEADPQSTHKAEYT